ncbi:MAG: HAMP domain-containing sensor histidine kinase [Thermodesulfobacteriota bacterium]
MPSSDPCANWQKAYLDIFQPACVGRHIKGTVHNLNGVIQAFSMQTELLEMMFSKCDQQLAAATEAVAEPDTRKLLTDTRELLQKRQNMLVRMEEKVNYSQRVLATTSKIANRSREEEGGSLDQLLTEVIDFFHSDMFFKHKVKLTHDLQSSARLSRHSYELATIMLCLMENGIEALQENAPPEAQMSLTSHSRDERLIITLSNNGPEIAATIKEKIFAPFFTTRPAKAGLGLHLSRQLAESMGGQISFTTGPATTTFTLDLPSSSL